MLGGLVRNLRILGLDTLYDSMLNLLKKILYA
ncbi:Mut7-C RNAse domain-containing protein [candidate division WOR-3 bacterium]|nr:Mut7-C RNAse domain-containing protein [candidate division WOR-3 bacterium]